MAAKGKDTTKTAHVMNLLRKNPPAAQPAEETAAKSEAARAEAGPAKPARSVHPMITSLNEEAAVSQEILGALEQELEKNEVQQEAIVSTQEATQTVTQESVQRITPAPAIAVPDAAQSAEPVAVKPIFEEFSEQEEETVVEADFVAEAEETASVVKEPVEEEIPAEQIAELVSESVEVENPVQKETVSEADKKEEPETPALEYCNVMQTMVEESAEKYMKMFNLCLCPRCRADVKALALNNLQPKYVVIQPGEFIPRITVYERQFSTAVTAQILRACKVIAEFPRHDML